MALNRSLSLAKEIGHLALQADAHTQLGQVDAEQGEVTRAISHLEQALGVAMEMPDQIRIMTLAGRLGSLFLGLSSLDKASEYYAQALRTAQDLQLQRPECSFIVSLGNVMLTNGEPGAAIEQFEQA